MPPMSKEEAVRQARSAIRVGLGRRGNAGRDGKFSDKSVLKRISKGNKRLVVDFPLQQDSPSNLAELAAELLEEVASEKTAFVFGSREACEKARGAHNLHNCYYAGGEPISSKKATSLVMVGVGEAQARELLLSRWQSVILINPKGFQAKSLTGSFDTVYQFLPLLVQGFLGSKAEGALFKCLSESQEEQSNNWNVFLKEGSSFKMIASQASRPDDDELELALYNNVATNNPVIKGIKSAKQNLDENLDKMKGLFSKEG